MTSRIEQNTERSAAPADNARTLLLMEAVESRFADFDTNKSNGLDRNELTAAMQNSNNAGAVSDGLSVLLLHYDDATNFASNENANPFTYPRAAAGEFKRTFGTDDVNDEVSLKDLAALELVTSSSGTQNVLNIIRGSELADGWFSVGMGVVHGVIGAFGIAAPTGVTQVVGGVNLAFAGYRAWSAYDNFANSDVPKFDEYINGKRATISAWQ